MVEGAYMQAFIDGFDFKCGILAFQFQGFAVF